MPKEGSYKPSCHHDISVNSRKKPRLLQLFLKQSKTDQFKHGANVYIGTTDTALYPMKAVLAYLVRRGSHLGPFL